MKSTQKLEMQMAVSRRQKAHHTIPGNIQGQQPTFWGVLYKVKQKLDAAGIQACIAINKKDDDKRAISKNAQQAHG